MTNYLMLLFLLMFYGWCDGMQDNIDHRSGARPLKDLWHTLKQLNRLNLLLCGGFMMTVKPTWALVPLLIGGGILAYLLWQTAYDLPGLAEADERFRLSFGKWLDKLLGLDR